MIYIIFCKYCHSFWQVAVLITFMLSWHYFQNVALSRYCYLSCYISEALLRICTDYLEFMTNFQMILEPPPPVNRKFHKSPRVLSVLSLLLVLVVLVLLFRVFPLRLTAVCSLLCRLTRNDSPARWRGVSTSTEYLYWSSSSLSTGAISR